MQGNDSESRATLKNGLALRRKANEIVQYRSMLATIRLGCENQRGLDLGRAPPPVGGGGWRGWRGGGVGWAGVGGAGVRWGEFSHPMIWYTKSTV